MKCFHDYLKEYANGGDKSYFTVSIPAGEEIKQYQIKMLENNKLDLLLPLSVQRINDDWKLFYNITSKIPLSRVLERKPIKQDAFLHIMLQIIKLISELKDYLLDLSSVVFDISYIFCDPSKLDLYFLYIPTEIFEDEQDKLKSFLKKLLVEDMNFMEDSSGVILKRFLEVLKEDNFSIEQLLHCISGEETAKEPLKIMDKLEKKPIAKIYDDFGRNQSKIEIPGIKSNKLNNQEISRPKNSQQNHIAQKGNPNKNKTAANFIYGNSADIKIGLTSVKRSYLIIGAIDLLMLVIFIFLAASKTIGSSNITGKITGMVLIFASINYFLFTRIVEKENHGNDNCKVEKQNMPVFKRFVNEDIEEDIILPKSPNNHINNENLCTGTSNDHETKKSTITNEYKKTSGESADSYNTFRKKPVSDKTVILGGGHTLFLQNIVCSTDKINLDKSSILIGRLEDSVDHVIFNNAVGKIHAELIAKDGKHYIVDLNSVNGTYINDERVLCNSATEINTGDKITFANESYTFIGL